MPITSAGLNHNISSEPVSTGVNDLDAMLGVGGYYRGSSVLISGLAGTGKSTFAAAFVYAACERGERCLYFAFEESAEQVIRNMRSVGMDLSPYLSARLLQFEAARPSLYGFEMHLARMSRDIEAFRPSVVVVDPISAFRGPSSEIHATLVRLADICKTKGITTLFTSLSSVGETMSESERSVSSLMDVWISLEDKEANGERNRVLYLLKSRGMNHSNQLREYRLSTSGIHMVEPYIGQDGVLTGTARLSQEAREREDEIRRRESMERRRREMARKRAQIERQIEELRAAIEAEETEVATLLEQEESRERSVGLDRKAMASSRGLLS